MKRIILLFLALPFFAAAQDKGTHFEHGLSWQQLKEKAKKENKYLFVDCFTTWCGPCKYMTANIFPQEKVGAFFNKNFVSVKVQFDKTKEDTEEVKNWYATAEYMSKEFKVRAYPTFLILSPKGELVHRIVGSAEADDFIAKAQMGLNPETQYYTLMKKHKSGKSDPQTLKQLAITAEAAYDQENAAIFSEAYLATQTDLFTKDNLEFLSKYTRTSKSKGFKLMLTDPQKVDAILGKGKSAEILGNVILEESIYPGLNKATANVDSLIAAAKVKYPGIDISKSTDLVRIQFFQGTKKWDRFQPAVLDYMKKYGSEVNPQMLNTFAWAVFQNCKDPECISAAMNWSKRSVDETDSKEPAFLDTYANLLYKMGKKDEALAAQQKAVDLVPAEKKAEYQATLDKMKKGE